jgi:DNA-binding IclR family transcriptional regulator
MQLPESLFVARTMQALELLALQPLSAPQLAAALQIHPRTARRLLSRLLDEGYVTRSDDARRRYAPTMRIVALAAVVVEHAQLTRVAVPVVRRLQLELGGTAHLAVPSHRSALCVVHCAAERDAPRPQIGELMPSHCTALGKALLTWRSSWRDAVLRDPLEPYTPRTQTCAEGLRTELERTRARGYATEDEEFEPGVRAVAAPLLAADGGAIAAVGAALPDGTSLELAAPRVIAAAQALADDYGRPGSSAS